MPIAPSLPIDSTWQSYFSQRCHPDVAALANHYPDRRSLYVDLVDLYGYDAEFTVALSDAPGRFLRRATGVLRDGREAFDHVNVRVTNNPAMFRLGDLGTRHLHELVTVQGVAESLGSIQATAAVAVFECRHCGEAVDVPPCGVRLSEPRRCESCDGDGAFEFRPGRSTFVDLRRVSFAAPRDERDDAADPRTLDVFLADDLVDAVHAGDQFLVTGIVRPVRVGPSNRFDLCVDGLTVAEERSAVEDRSLAEVIQSRWESMGGEG